MDKVALLGQIARIARQDIPGTPRWVLPKASPAQLAGIQHKGNNLLAPLKDKLPALPGVLRKPAGFLLDHPEAALAVPVLLPGASLVAMAAKRGLEKGLDYLSPLPKLGFAINEFSGPMNPDIRSGASDLPPFRMPQLRRGIQKNSGAVTPMVGPSGGDLVKAGMDAMLLDLLDKVAALSREEHAELKRRAVQHASFDRRAGQGENVSKEMRENADRIKFLRDKKKTSRTHDFVKAQVGRLKKLPRPVRVAAVGAGIPLAIVGAGAGIDKLTSHMDRKKKKEREMAKAAASAPTRGNFMMASDLPGWRQPQLERGIQKNSGETSMPVSKNPSGASIPLENSGKSAAGMPDGVTTDSNDFKPAKLSSITTEQLAFYVRDLRKQADVSPASSWNGGTFGGAGPRNGVSDIPPFRSPRLDRGIQKQGMAGITPAGQLSKTQSVGAPKVAPPPGPSIADQVKPRGARFGSAIPGAQKSGIGGYVQPDLKL